MAREDHGKVHLVVDGLLLPLLLLLLLVILFLLLLLSLLDDVSPVQHLVVVVAAVGDVEHRVRARLPAAAAAHPGGGGDWMDGRPFHSILCRRRSFLLLHGTERSDSGILR